ncbi:hypothetical protein B0T22DRAFT_159087 [Podospora appendiculata]|uniref:Uncharacterized protein n=1 Tax=Podospora appendiculata TaxID=314037 RepID=A0AAE1CCK1_9PEZI|nr:hypothetical protein B0T22DRAFT_159087 [Podospora appendiculata]
MGLLSFFSRKPTDKGKTDGFPKSKAYHSASSGMLPVQGAYPVAGNGPNIMETLNNSRPKFSQTQLSLDRVSAADHAAPVPTPTPAPAPTVPRYRDESLERPSTAPNGSQPSTMWGSASSRVKKGTMRGPPPVSFRMVSRGSANMDCRPTSRGTGETTEITCASHSHSRSNSIRSDGGRGFKDILDAQSEIRPADFKTRIKAVGARDYGEDVAERNMGENGFLLESPQVQAFYAQIANTSRQGHIDDHPPAAQHDVQSIAYATGVRTKSLNSSSHYSHSLPKMHSYVPQVRGSQPASGAPFTKGPRRRRSLNTFMAVVSSDAEPGPLMHPDPHAGAGSKPPRQHAGTTGIEHTSKLPPSRTNKGAPIILPPPGRSHRPHTRPAKFPRDSVLVAKRRAGASTPDLHADDDTSNSHVPSERSFPLRSSFHSHRGSASASSASGVPRQRHSLHTLESSVSSPLASCETLGGVTPLDYPRTRSRHSSRQKQSQEDVPAGSGSGSGSLTKLAAVNSEGEGAVSQTEVVDSAPPSPPYSKAHFTIRETRESLDSRTEAATRSLTAASTHPNTSLDDVTEHSPLRTRSLRAWSSSSATPTASDASSNSFQRPQSRHTANTSVDLSNASASLKASSHSSFAASPNTPKSANFNIDDYISSDDDSFTTAHRAAGAEGEEDLLFSDAGYGANGFQLPGLFDSLTSPSRAGPQQSSLAQRHHSSPALSSTRPSRRQMTYSGDSFGRAAGRRFVLDTAADSDYYSDAVLEYNGDDIDDYDDGGGGGDSIFDDAVSRTTRSPQCGATKRLSALRVHRSGNSGGCGRHSVSNCYSTTDEVIEEENEGKVDVAAAVRLRKEVKQRKRAAGASGKRAAKGRGGGSGSRSTFLNGEGGNKEGSHGLGLQVHIKGEGDVDEGEQADAE